MALTRNPRGCYLSNPPYGMRLNPDDLDVIYDTFNELFKMTENYGGIITACDWRPEGEWDEKTFFN